MLQLRPVGASACRRPRRLAFWFGAAIACVVVSALTSYRALSAGKATALLLRRAADTRLAIEGVESALFVSEASLDAWVATADEGSGARYASSRRHEVPDFAALRTLVADEPEQGTRFRQLAVRTEALFAIQDRARDAMARGDVPAARRIDRSEERDRVVQEARAIIDDMEVAEDRVLSERQAEWARSVEWTNAVMLASGAILVLLLVIAGRAVRRELARRQRDADERTRMIDVQRTLMAVVGHDLRNPLAAIHQCAALLARGPLAERESRHVGRIGSAARRMERLIRDLLDYTRVRAGAEIPVVPVHVDVAEVCGRVLEDLGPDAVASVRVDAEGDLGGDWDPERLEQVIANLVTNALKHGPADAPVGVRLTGGRDGVTIEVHDAGGRLTPELRALLFEPFHRGEGGARGGVGLGLFVVRTLVQAHRGTIEVSSDPASGTTFTVRLPRGVASPGETAARVAG
jgi:signal transduction histidine kinase